TPVRSQRPRSIVRPTPLVFFFNDPARSALYTLSLHDALPICCNSSVWCARGKWSSSNNIKTRENTKSYDFLPGRSKSVDSYAKRSEEHTSELQSRFDLVCRLLLEKKKID